MRTSPECVEFVASGQLGLPRLTATKHSTLGWQLVAFAFNFAIEQARVCGFYETVLVESGDVALLGLKCHIGSGRAGLVRVAGAV